MAYFLCKNPCKISLRKLKCSVRKFTYSHGMKYVLNAIKLFYLESLTLK